MDGWMDEVNVLILNSQMEEQRLWEYFLNWFISKPIYEIISVFDFDLLRKAKEVNLILGLVLLLHSE